MNMVTKTLNLLSLPIAGAIAGIAIGGIIGCGWGALTGGVATFLLLASAIR